MNIRSRVRSGEVLVGTWMSGCNPVYAELCALADLDFVIIDMEHGLIGLEDIVPILQALRAGGRTAALVRVPSHDATMIARVLDRGVDGIVVPKIEDVAEARGVIAAAKYPTAGTRGVAIGVIRASQYGMNPGYRHTANDEILICLQIESRRAVENAAAVAAVDGVDILFIGPSDLAADMNLEGPINTQNLIGVIDGTIATLCTQGFRVGTMPHAGRDWQSLAQMGVTLHATGSDVQFLRQGIASIKSTVPSRKESDGAAK
jgi:4-hydroxy-2-oxoheptanedioate aldolase